MSKIIYLLICMFAPILVSPELMKRMEISNLIIGYYYNILGYQHNGDFSVVKILTIAQLISAVYPIT